MEQRVQALAGNITIQSTTANSTSATKSIIAAAAVGVRPPLQINSAVYRRFASRFQKMAMPLLHIFDPVKPPDSKLALKVLWWKALAANDPTSPVFDNSLTYDMLPGGSRLVVSRKLRPLYPRFAHAVVEIRTAFLDQTVTRVAQEVRSRDPTKVRLISLGGGYDVRSMKLRERGVIDQAIELDLPQVVEAKTRILQSKRFKRRRPNMVGDMLPEFYSADLNKVDQVKSTLEDILGRDTAGEHWHTIFLFEGVMIYLDDGVPDALLGVCRQALKTTGLRGTLCFADELENFPNDDLETARTVFAAHEWVITDWLPKGGKTRHMGCAEMM